MKLVITEKNDAAKKIAELLAPGKPKPDKVYDTPVFRFDVDGEEWVTIGLRGHILEVNFYPTLTYDKKQGWFGIDEDGVVAPVELPDGLPKPPFKKRSPFLPDSVNLKAWKLNGLPYLVYGPLQKLPKEKGIIRSVKNLANKADSVVIATDFDREGELIGSDALAMVREVAPNIPASRARYSSFTKSEITEAFDNLVELDTDLASAGESRQWIDLIWGAVLTRYLTIVRQSGFGKVRPSGRVQTPTLALVVAKEEERNAFVPEVYWVLKGICDASADAATNGGALDADKDDAFEVTHATARFKDEAAAKAAFSAVQDANAATVVSIEKKSRQSRPPAPFNTTSLQAAGAAEGLSPARTMRIAESLYMKGLTSYPRVDNTVYPKGLSLRGTASMLAKIPAYAPYVNKLLEKDKLTATRGKTQTTDHPPIYPTGVANKDKLRADEWKLYNLIARRFLATLSDAATIENTKVTLDVNGEPFTTKGDILVKAGYRGIYPYGLKKDEQLPQLAEGQRVAFGNAALTKKQTEPPARYSQGRLVQEMEKHGLGTKSTRASIIERLTDVHYIQGDPVEPTQLGVAIIDALHKYAPHITTSEMTAELEDEMSSIADGRDTRDGVVNHSRELLAGIMDELLPRTEEVGDMLADAVAADAKVGVCPKCGKDLQLKSSMKTKSNFIGCSGWPDCDVTYPVPQGKIQPVEEACPTCGKPQIKIIQFRRKPIVRCVDPDCPSNQEPTVNVGECPTCKAAGIHGDLIAQRSPRTLKRFIRCSNYETCGTSFPLPQDGELKPAGEVCEACGTPKVIVTTRRGPWEICPNMECPLREEKEAAKATKAKGGKSKTSKSKKSTARKK
ncbi:MAG: DNA topoisomerase I [Coriobacteriales bacterium]|nr:DNA topoisomerase I [Coriobacteriales bacterium]